MLNKIALALLALWILGFVSSNTLGGGIHILLAAALILFLVRYISGRRTV